MPKGCPPESDAARRRRHDADQAYRAAHAGRSDAEEQRHQYHRRLRRGQPPFYADAPWYQARREEFEQRDRAALAALEQDT